MQDIENDIHASVRRIMSSGEANTSLRMETAGLDNVAWNDFAAYVFILPPIDERLPVPNEGAPMPTSADEEARLISDNDTGEYVATFIRHLKGLVRTGLKRGWTGSYTYYVKENWVRTETRLLSDDGAILIQHAHDMWWEVNQPGSEKHKDSYDPINLTEAVSYIFGGATSQIVSELFSSYDKLERPGFPLSVAQAAFDSHIINFFHHRLRPLGIGWHSVRDTYFGLVAPNTLDQGLITDAWRDLVSSVISEFPVPPEPSIEERTLDSLFEQVAIAKTKVPPYSFGAVFAPGSYNLGIRLVYRQEWRWLGNQRGEVVRTLPLGPRQTEKVSTKATRRVKYSESSETIRSTETTEDVSMAAKTSSDITQDMMDTFKWSVGVDGGANFIVGKVDVNSSIGGELTRQTKSDTSFLSESAKKVASKSRAETKVVVSTERESEFETSVSSEISNPNEEIAITYVYSRLQQQFEILTRLAELQKVVMIAETVPAPEEVEYEWVRRYDWIIAKVLLDGSFRDALSGIRGSTENPGQGELGIVLLDKIKSGMEKLGDFALTQNNQAQQIDFIGEAQRGFREFNREELARYKENLLLEIGRQRLYQHIRDNILHYCRAIWAHEDSEQRILRYRNEGKRIPLQWEFVPTTSELDIAAMVEVASPFGIGGYGVAGELAGEFKPLGSAHVLASEIVNPAGPIGYYGNYAIYYIRSEVAGRGNIFPMLSILQSPYLYYENNSSRGKVMDPVLIGFKRFVEELDSVSDSVIEKAKGEMVQVLPELSLALQAAQEEGPGAESAFWENYGLFRKHYADYLIVEVKEEMAQFVPELRVELRLAEEEVEHDPGSAALDAFWADNQLFRKHYADYLYREEMSRRFVMDTQNLVLDIMPGEGSALEPFKLAHRGLDVMSKLAEVQAQELENDRLEARKAKEVLTDPKTDRVVVVYGDPNPPPGIVGSEVGAEGG